MRLLISATAHGRLHSDVQADQTLPSSAEPGVAKQLGLKIYGQAQRCPFVLSSPSSTLFVPRFEERPASHRDGDAKVKLARRLARRELRKLRRQWTRGPWKVMVPKSLAIPAGAVV
eukprot:6180376-Pleurochrysis_carterae.AAC.2